MQRRRNSLRYEGWNYAASGYYFVTICTHGRDCFLDSAKLQNTVEITLQQIPSFAESSRIELDAWVVMPNHVHLIVVIVEGVSAETPPATKTESGSLGAVIGTFKSTATRRVNNVRRTQYNKVWQRGYYDRIIRNERELNATREYIRLNPQRWQEDRENLDALFEEMTYHDSA